MERGLIACFARNIGAILSAYLEHQLGGRRLGAPGGFGVVTTVPSSRPVVAAALGRAAREGWWSPQLAVVARARPGHVRQRRRPDTERMYVRNKWEVDRAAVDGQDVLVLDDIYTSGGSVHSLARALCDAGAASVRAVVLARNVGARDAAWALRLLWREHGAGRRWSGVLGWAGFSRRAGGGRGRGRSAALAADRLSCRPCRPR